MYNDRSEEEIKRNMLNNIKNTIDKSENSLVHDAIGPAANEFKNAYIQLDYVAGKIDPENLEGIELENYVKRSNVTRKLATKATTTVKIEGEQGASIYESDAVATDDVNFFFKETKKIDESGIAYILVECEVKGSIGNVPAGAINKFPVQLNGLNSVANLEEVVSGYDDELDRELLDRYYEKIRSPITSGNKYHYSFWAKEVEGVGDAKIIPLWNGDNTVKVIIIDDNKQLASSGLIEEVQEHIDPKSMGLGSGMAPIGAFCTVVSAAGKDINISVDITRDTNFTLEQIKESIENRITSYLKEVAFKRDMISYAQIGALILGLDEVLDYKNLTINGFTENIFIGNEEVAILKEVIANE